MQGVSLWLAPKQIVVAPITSDIKDYAIEVAQKFKKAGLRVEVDDRNEKINYKIREHSHAKVPVILVVGAREKAEKTVAMRRLGGESQEVLALNDVFAKLVAEAKNPAFD